MIDLDQIVKVSQVIFYVSILYIIYIIYILTKKLTMYFTNDVYAKKVVESLNCISEQLFSEFDISSDKHWINNTMALHITVQINKKFLQYKEELLAGKSSIDYISIPDSEIEQRINTMADRYRSDPFIPQPIRRLVVSMLDARSNALMESSRDTASFYISKLVNKDLSELNENSMTIHNYLILLLNKNGFGTTDVESKVADIRIHIQNYLTGSGNFPEEPNAVIPCKRHYG